MVVHVDDAGTPADGADVDPRTDEADQGRVTDRDLQTLVNEVWAAGAEAVTVNGQRLTALSAIRSAGDAVLVDFRPLNPPYTCAPSGPDTMRDAFVGRIRWQLPAGPPGLRDHLVDRRLQAAAAAGVSRRQPQVRRGARRPRPRPDRTGATPGAGASTGSAQ